MQLTTQNAGAAIAALSSIGYRSRAPVPAEQFADATMRASWIADKGLTVALKKAANRPLDLADIAALEALEESCEED